MLGNSIKLKSGSEAHTIWAGNPIPTYREWAADLNQWEIVKTLSSAYGDL